MSMTMALPAAAAPAARPQSGRPPTQTGETGGSFEATLDEQLAPAPKEGSLDSQPKGETGDSSAKQSDGPASPQNPVEVPQEAPLTALSVFSFLAHQVPTTISDDSGTFSGEVTVPSTPSSEDPTTAAVEISGELTEQAAALSAVSGEADGAHPSQPAQAPATPLGAPASQTAQPTLQNAQQSDGASGKDNTGFGSTGNLGAEPTTPRSADAGANSSTPLVPETATELPESTPPKNTTVPAAAPETTAPHSAGRADTTPTAIAAPNAQTQTTAGTDTVRPAQPQPATTPAGMLDQVRGPVGRLAQAAQGEHTFTVNVTPENLGPVTVRAHITGDSIRVELIGATDAARDSLRGIMNELRKDLQSTGMNAQLNLSNESGTHNPAFAQSEQNGRGATPTGNALTQGSSHQGSEEPEPAPHRDHAHGDLSVDILA